MDKNRVREDCDILIVFLPLVVIWAAREVVCFVVLPRFVDQFVVVFHKSGNVPRHSSIDFLWVAPVL
jgi:hypothetical protein